LTRRLHEFTGTDWKKRQETLPLDAQCSSGIWKTLFEKLSVAELVRYYPPFKKLECLWPCSGVCLLS
jgi:hypothetical protein